MQSSLVWTNLLTAYIKSRVVQDLEIQFQGISHWSGIFECCSKPLEQSATDFQEATEDIFV